MKSIFAVLFALAVGSQALYPLPVVPAVQYGLPPLQVVEPTSAPVQPVQEQVVVAKPVEYSYSYSIPEGPAQPQPQAPASPVVVEQGSVQPPFVSVESLPGYNGGVHIPYPYSISPISFPYTFYNPTEATVDLAHSYIAPAPYYSAPSIAPVDLSYSYTALPNAPVSVVYGSSGYGIPANGIPYYSGANIPLFPTIPAPEIFPAVDSNVSPLFQLLNSSYSYTIPYASVHVAQVGDAIKPAEEKPEENAEKEVQAVVSEIVLPQKPAVISYEYGIPQAPKVVVQEVKPVVPHTEYGVPLL